MRMLNCILSLFCREYNKIKEAVSNHCLKNNFIFYLDSLNACLFILIKIKADQISSGLCFNVVVSWPVNDRFYIQKEKAAALSSRNFSFDSPKIS